ncbi:MAG TPA: DUF938 domain-containing protein [Bacteriovoracaceae bacterium]|nr:DUF938 domain-containing protein [Bacteriovoracaceae bacterium]
MEKPYSPACDNNKGPILEVLKQYITTDNRKLLEIGTGTGQHAVFLAAEFPFIDWVTSDRAINHSGIKQWLTEAQVNNVKGPVEFEIGKDEFPKNSFDLVFTANTFHIMHWKECKSLMKMLGHRLREGAQVFIYGPFNYQGQFTSKSNEEFDRSLKARDPLSGIRAFEDVDTCMKKNGFAFCNDHPMPANNRILVYTRLEFVK